MKKRFKKLNRELIELNSVTNVDIEFLKIEQNVLRAFNSVN